MPEHSYWSDDDTHIVCDKEIDRLNRIIAREEKHTDELYEKIARMEAALEAMLEAPYEQPIGCWSYVMRSAITSALREP